jgi:mono/diheme cytochrome c family protein
MKAATTSTFALSLALPAALALGALSGCKRAKSKPDALTEARTTFAMVCARCHGPDGGGGGITPGIAAPRNFRDAQFQKERSDDDLLRAIREGKGAMPPFNNVYSAEQMTALVQVIRGFNPEKSR